MENREHQILSEIKALMASVRSQLELLDAKMSEFQQVVDPEEIDVAPIDLEIPQTQNVETVDDDLPFDDIPVESIVEEPVLEILPEEDTEVTPSMADLSLTEEPEIEETRVVIDVMTDKYSWRADMPGLPVKDVRSAISLNDRVLFINYLFKEDPMAFMEALTNINQMSSVDEVVDFITQTYPDWDLASDVVYRFMMAVRRKIR